MEEGGINQPELAGREAELAALGAKLAAASEGRGGAIFISGEAGLGKTRLVSEIINSAEKGGFRTVRGWCLAETLEPLMPLRAAFREAGLLHLVSGDPPPLVVSAYLVDDSGLLIAGSEREGLTLDPLIFSSMLKAVGDFVKDSMDMVEGSGGSGGLNILGYGDYKIIMEAEGNLHLACVTKGGLNEMLVTDMRDVLARVQGSFGHILKDWDGDMDSVAGAEETVSGLVKSGKYSGRFLVDDPKLRQENLFDNVLLGLQRSSSETPLLLFLDDLQWSDQTTLNLLHYLARNIRTDRILILGAYRPEDIIQNAHPLAAVMREMNREDCLERLELKRLDLGSTEKVITSALGPSSLDAEFFAMIHEETGGTPLFILEVLKLLLAEGFIVRDPGGCRSLADEMGKIELPSKVYDVVQRRLDRLTASQAEVLECAAVIGEEFSADILCAVLRTERLPLLKTLAEVEKSHRLIHSSGKSHVFDHAKVREVLYSGIMDELRFEYHRLVAEALVEAHGTDIGAVLNELAYHYCQANDPRAGPLLLRVGDAARERYSNREAIKAYRNALGFLAEGERHQTMERLGDLLVLVGNYGEAAEIFGKLADQGDADPARVLRKLSDIHLAKGDFDLALETLERARAVAAGLELGRITFSQGCVNQRKGNNDLALELLTEALRLFEDAGEERDIANALRFIGSIHWNNGDYENAMKNFTLSLGLMESLKDENGAVSALVNIGIVHWNRGEYDKALECYGRSLGITEKIGYRAGMATVLANLGLVYWDKGELAKSLEHQERSLSLFEKMGDQRGIASVLGNISLVHRDRGSLDDSLEIQKRSLAMRERMGDRAGIALSLLNTGDIHRDMGRPDKATEFYRMSLAICRDIGDKRISVHNLCGMAEVGIAMGNTAAALENSAEALGISLEMGARFEEGMSRRVRGMALRASGDARSAAEEFSAAASVLADIGDTKELAKLMYEQSLLHRELGEADRAGELLASALAEFGRMGMELWAEKCRKAGNHA